MIKYYNTEAEYEAAVKTSRESQLSLVGSDNNVCIDGVNVVVGLASAKTGAACVLDEHSAMHFIAPGTFSKDSFPANYTYVGPVLVGVDHPEFRGKVIIGYKYIQNLPIHDAGSWRLKGYTLDGADHEAEIGFNDPDTGRDVRYPFTYNANTVDELVSELNEFFANIPSAGLQAQDWTAIGLDTDSDGVNDAIDIKGWRASHITTHFFCSGFSGTGNNFLPDIYFKGYAEVVTMNGQWNNQPAIGNMTRVIELFSEDINTGLYNPTAVLTDANYGNLLCLPAYLGTSQYRDGDKCAAVRAVYGEGEEGWKKFLEGFKLLKPSTYGIVGDKKWGDGKTNTYIMANDTFTGRSGVIHRASEVAYDAMNLSYNHELLRAGNWYMPDIDELESIMQTIQFGTIRDRNADPINATQLAAGGSPISNKGSYISVTRRLSGQYYGYTINGTIGAVTSYGNNPNDIIIICSINL